MAIRILIDTHVRLPLADLEPRLLRSLKHANELPNPQRENARREHVRGWERIPETIFLWEEVGTHLILPRGFLARLCTGLDNVGIEWELDDDRSEVVRTWSVEGALTPIKLDPRRDQLGAVEALLANQQGVLMAPPGMGKTSTMLELVRRCKQRSIIVVETSHIAGQWVERAADFLGVEVGMVGDGQWEEKDITIAMRQTLWSRREQLWDEGFFDRWGLYCADECHHVQANALYYITSLFPAKYRYGLSATPDRNNGLFPLVLSALGPVVHEVSKPQLVEAGVLVRPTVHRVATDFEFEFVPTHQKIIRNEYGTVIRKQLVRNNFEKMVKALISDVDRAQLVVEHVLRNPDGRQLVLSKRLAHLKLLRDTLVEAGYPEDRAYMLTGAQDSEERLRVARYVEQGPCVVFSTVADEALDVPSLDVLHLPYPTANPAIVTQQVGRVERAAKGKSSAKVYDYVDDVSVLQRQAGTRLQAYRDNGYAT